MNRPHIFTHFLVKIMLGLSPFFPITNCAVMKILVRVARVTCIISFFLKRPTELPDHKAYTSSTLLNSLPKWPHQISKEGEGVTITFCNSIISFLDSSSFQWYKSLNQYQLSRFSKDGSQIRKRISRNASFILDPLFCQVIILLLWLLASSGNTAWPYRGLTYKPAQRLFT